MERFPTYLREGQGSWRKARSKDTNAETMHRISWSTKEDMENGPSTDNQDPSMEYIAGPIEVCYQADGFFGQDRPPRLDIERESDRHLYNKWYGSQDTLRCVQCQ